MPKQERTRQQGGSTGQSPTNITQYLKGIDFPCNKNDLINRAKQNGAEHTVITLLQSIGDRQYMDMADVMKSYNQARGAESGVKPKKTAKQKPRLSGAFLLGGLSLRFSP